MYTDNTPRLTLVCSSKAFTPTATTRKQANNDRVVCNNNSIDEALDNFERLCFQLNEKRRHKDEETARQEAILSVAQKIDPPLVQLTDSATRMYKSELDVQHVNQRRKVVSARHVFVFSDLLLLTKYRKRSGRYAVKSVVALRSAVAEPLAGPQELLGKSFPFVLRLLSTDDQYLLAFDSAAAMAAFAKEVHDCQTYHELLDMEFD